MLLNLIKVKKKLDIRQQLRPGSFFSTCSMLYKMNLMKHEHRKWAGPEKDVGMDRIITYRRCGQPCTREANR